MEGSHRPGPSSTFLDGPQRFANYPPIQAIWIEEVRPSGKAKFAPAAPEQTCIALRPGRSPG